jgi:hypothetical protein
MAERDLTGNNRMTLENLDLMELGAPKKGARPSSPGTLYSLRRNIFRKSEKTMASAHFCGGANPA